MPGITRTREGLNKLDRERKRLAAPERKPPMRVASHKLCRRCQLVKPYSEFSSWRVRVCLACDGPPLLRG
jgi:hypothetical protein